AEKIIKNCHVSKRTVFRDMALLADLNFPVYYNEGYRLLKDSQLAAQDLSEIEKEFICYCLRISNLNQSERFKNIIDEIEAKLSNRPWKRGGTNRGHIIGEMDIKGLSILDFNKSESIISIFWEALFYHSEIRLKKIASSKYISGLIPIKFSIIGNEIIFEFKKKHAEKIFTVKYSEIVDFLILSK
ncbi:MAG: hypothetical protein ABIJ45_05090, partial [Candidatus Zixiibacteriota bacterium]